MLQLYILSKDRPEYLRSAIISALNQDNKDIEIIVSDNSETSKVSEMMRTDFSSVNYIKRTSLLSPFDHTLAVIEEATSDYMIIFHDDDMMQNTHVSNLLIKLKQYPDVAAVCSNATFFGDSFLNSRKVMNIKNEVLIKSPIQLFEYYLGLHPSGSSCAPLPGYIFKTSIIKKVINLIIESGKHGDVHLLGEILNYGHILWLPTPTLYYRIHTSQASFNESIYSRHQVLNMMSSFGINLQSKSVIYYKFMYLSRWWKSRNRSILRIPIGMKERIVAKFLVCSFLYLFFSSKIFLMKIFRLILFVFSRKLDKFKY